MMALLGWLISSSYRYSRCTGPTILHPVKVRYANQLNAIGSTYFLEPPEQLPVNVPDARVDCIDRCLTVRIWDARRPRV